MSAIEKDRDLISEQFNKNETLQRIILYIDDLDRCSDEKVLEVLQAVHLLMAFPLFIVVVGVDKRCVSNALNYRNILQYVNSTGVVEFKDLKEKFNIEAINPDEYLEKIFQIPFQVPDANSDGIKRLIEDLFKIQGDGKEKELNEEGHEAAEGNEVKSESPSEMAGETVDEETTNQEKVPEAEVTTFDGSDTPEIAEREEKPEAELEPELDTNGQFGEPSKKSVAGENKEEKKDLRIHQPPDLSITREEIEQVKSLSGLVGYTPRTIKRFVNLYRIMKGHEQISRETHTDKEKLAILFALAINIGTHKAKARELFREMSLSVPGSEADRTGLKTIGDFINDENYPEFYRELSENKMEEILEIECDALTKHLPFIRRFSFGESNDNGENLIGKESIPA